jgi:dihydroxy-acid dehydratase
LFLFILAAAHNSHEEKIKECVKAAGYLKRLLELDLKPSDIVTRQSFLNAIVIVNGVFTALAH